MKTKIKSDEVTDFHDNKFQRWTHGDFHDKKFQRWNHTCLTVISFGSALKKDGNFYPQVFSKECNYIEKKVVGHIHDNLNDFPYSSDESQKEKIKVIRLMIFENVFFEEAISKESNEK